PRRSSAARTTSHLPGDGRPRFSGRANTNRTSGALAECVRGAAVTHSPAGPSGRGGARRPLDLEAAVAQHVEGDLPAHAFRASVQHATASWSRHVARGGPLDLRSEAGFASALRTDTPPSAADAAERLSSSARECARPQGLDACDGCVTVTHLP